MRYLIAHPRKIRGRSVHLTMEEKKETEVEEKRHDLVTVSVRNSVEEACLVPEIKNFVNAPDVKLLSERIMLWIQSGYPVHIIGPTGCGKTSMALHIAEGLGRNVVWINGDEAVTTNDLVGGYAQLEQESLRDRYIHNVFKSSDIMKAEWVDNPLAIACKNGYTLVYNEFSRTKPTANNVLLSVLEEGILELPTKFGEERYIKVHPDFNVILTSNSIEYAGVHRPQDALLDRLVSIYMSYYGADTECKIVKAHTGLSVKDSKRIVGIVRWLRDQLPDAQQPGTRACIMIGKGVKNFKERISFEQICLDVLSAKTCSPADLKEKESLVRQAIKEVS